MWLTLEEAEQRFQLIQAKALQGDDEAAHSEEDALRDDVLRTITACDNVHHCKGLAKIALKSNDLQFARWCA